MLSESGNYESVTKSQTASALYATGEQHGEQANNCSPTQKHQAVEGPHRGHTRRRGIPYLSTSSIAIRLELLPLLEKSCIRTRHSTSQHAAVSQDKISIAGQVPRASLTATASANGTTPP